MKRKGRGGLIGMKEYKKKQDGGTEQRQEEEQKRGGHNREMVNTGVKIAPGH